MTSITIYDPNGGYVHEATITKDARVFRQLGGEHYVELSFESSVTLPLTRGCYVSITSLSPFNYFLKNDAVPEPIADAKGYKYVLKFYAYEHYMEACQIKWLTYGEDNVIDKRELTFSVTTSLKEYANLIANNMNDHLDTMQWTIADDEMEDDKYTKDMKELSFDGVSCWDAIGDIANAFGVEWWVEHTKTRAVIHFGKCEAKGDAIDIFEGGIVNRFPAPKRGEDSNYGTRFYIYGGTQNIPEDYSGSSAGTDVNHISEKRLRPRDTYGRYVDYYDPVSELPKSQIVEKTIILDNIFPKADATIEEVREETRTINGVDNVPIYLIKVNTEPKLLGQLGITFTSGALMGRTFDAKYHLYEESKPDGSTSKTHYIEILYQIEGANGSAQIVVPNANLKPEVGDKYILTGVVLDDSSIQKAEVELYTKGCELAKQYSTDTNVYDCPVNPVYCQINRINFEIGAKVILIGAHFGDEGRYSRVQGYEKKLYNSYIATYNIGDNRTYSRWNVIKSELLVASAVAEKKQELKEQTLKVQVQSSTSEAQLRALQTEVTKLKGTDKDTKESVSITGAKLYAESIRTIGYKELTNGSKIYDDTKDSLTVIGARKYADSKVTTLQGKVESGEVSPTRLMIGGTQVKDDDKIGFWINPSEEYKKKYGYQGSDPIALKSEDAKERKGVCVFVDKEYTDDRNPATLKPMLGVSLGVNDVLISDGEKWRKLSNTSIEGKTGDISKVKLVQLLTTADSNNTSFTPLAKQEDVSSLDERVKNVERRVKIAVVVPHE